MEETVRDIRERLSRAEMNISNLMQIAGANQAQITAVLSSLGQMRDDAHNASREREDANKQFLDAVREHNTQIEARVMVEIHQLQKIIAPLQQKVWTIAAQLGLAGSLLAFAASHYLKS